MAPTFLSVLFCLCRRPLGYLAEHVSGRMLCAEHPSLLAVTGYPRRDLDGANVIVMRETLTTTPPGLKVMPSRLHGQHWILLQLQLFSNCFKATRNTRSSSNTAPTTQWLIATDTGCLLILLDLLFNGQVYTLQHCLRASLGVLNPKSVV